jgi:hypothetical protein
VREPFPPLSEVERELGRKIGGLAAGAGAASDEELEVALVLAV